MAHEYARYLHEQHGLSTGGSLADTSTDKPVSEDLNVRDASEFLRQIVKDHLGIFDATVNEIQLLLDKPLEFASWLFADMVSRRAQTGWSTHGHSGADVNIYSTDASVAKALIGNHENTEIGDFLRNYLGVDVKAITDELKMKGAEWDKENTNSESWMGQKPALGEVMDGGSHLERYQGEFRMHRH